MGGQKSRLWRAEARFTESSDVEGALEGTFFGLDLLLQLKNSVENRFRARRTAGNVDVDGDDLVAALNDGVVVEDSAGRGASTNEKTH